MRSVSVAEPAGGIVLIVKVSVRPPGQGSANAMT